jgi:Domain of unknown function (DUF4326)
VNDDYQEVLFFLASGPSDEELASMTRRYELMPGFASFDTRMLTALKAERNRRDHSSLVVHCKQASFDVYIGRPSAWGNPFAIGSNGDRNAVVEKYETYLLGRPDLMSRLIELRGKVLGCWCAPAVCHGDVLAKYANRESL